MKLYERFGDSGFHSSIISTFCVDFDAFEAVVLPRLTGAGCRNNLVIVDRRMLWQALAGASQLPRAAGRRYSIIEAMVAEVFHPKLILQVGRRRGRLIVASANQTSAGLAGNLELAGVVECTDEISNAQRLIAAAYRYLVGHTVGNGQSVSRQLTWLEARTAWLRKAVVSTGAVELDNNSVTAFVASGEATGILSRFVSQIGEDRIRQLVVLSPYWDEDLKSVKELVKRLRPDRVVLLIDPERALFPGPALKKIPEARVLSLTQFAGGRFVHAKMIVATSKSKDHVLYGSANCTFAALGTSVVAGPNAEACLYRQMPAGTILGQLGFDTVLAEGAYLNAQDLPKQRAEVDLDLHKIARRTPGKFECVHDRLTWWPPSGLVDSTPVIELLDEKGELIVCTLITIARVENELVQYRITATETRPRFARLVYADGSRSIPAIVAKVDALLSAARERDSKAKVRLAERIDEDTEIDLTLIEVLDEIESAERETTSDRGQRRKTAERSPKEEGVYRILDYARFMAGRSIRTERSELDRSSLIGSEHSFIRDFMNRVVSNELATVDLDLEEDAEEDAGAFDLGDEVANDERDLESGRSLDVPDENPEPQKSDEESAKEASRRRARQRYSDRAEIAKAVVRLGDRLRTRADQGELTTFDLLRVRAILLVVASTGWGGSDADQFTNDGLQPRTVRQVLPKTSSDDRWPRLLGMTLHSLFGGTRPAVLRLNIDAIHDQLPDDVIECWATCYWAAQAAVVASSGSPSSVDSIRKLAPLVATVYRLTGLTTPELQGQQVTNEITKLNSRFGDRLGVEAAELVASHRRTAAGLFGRVG